MSDARERGAVGLQFHKEVRIKDSEPSSGSTPITIVSSEQLGIFRGTRTYQEKYGINDQTGSGGNRRR